MPKQRKKPSHLKKKAVHATNCGIAAIGSFGVLALAIWFNCFAPTPKEIQQQQALQKAQFERIMADRQKPAPVEFVSKPVHLYKPGEKLSKSAAAVAKANDVALLAVFDAGRP